MSDCLWNACLHQLSPEPPASHRQVIVPGAGREVNEELATVLMEALQDGTSVEEALSMKEAMIEETQRAMSESASAPAKENSA